MFLDEVSQIPLALAICLEHLHNAGPTTKCIGNKWQHQPVEPMWRGKPVAPDAAMHAHLLKFWCDCTCYELTRYGRSMEITFADWFIRARHMSREAAIADAIANSPAKPGPTDWHVRTNHHKRRIAQSLTKVRLHALERQAV